MMPLSGVRISWLMFIMNSDLMRRASSAVSRAATQLGVLDFEFGKQTSADFGPLAHRQRLRGGGPGFLEQLSFADLAIAIGDLFAAQQIAQLRLGDGEVARLHDKIVDAGAERIAHDICRWDRR